MGTETIQSGKIGELSYKIVLLDDKYTIYVRRNVKEGSHNEKNRYSAVASFDDIESAKQYVAGLAKR